MSLTYRPTGHNWDTPNRRAAFGSRDPRRSLRAGPLGPPIGSRPRPSTEAIPAAPTQQGGEAAPSEQSTSSDSNSRANQGVYPSESENENPEEDSTTDHLDSK